MPTLRSVGRVLLSIHVFIACCAVLLCIAAEKTFLQSVPPLFSPLHGLLAASTLLAYNAHALLNGPWLTGEALMPWQKRMHAGIALGAGLLVVCLLPFVSPRLWIGLAVLGALTAAYSTPLLPFRYKQRLKDFGSLKLAVLVGTWVFSTTWLPALKWSIPFDVFWPELVIRTALLLALCIAFDIRDVEADRAAGIYTLPVQIGAGAAYVLAYSALVLCVAFTAVLPENLLVLHGSLTAVCVGCGFAALAVEWSRRYPSEGAYLLLVDGALAAYAGAVLLL